MGIPMDDIHTPTVASGPTSAPGRNGRELSSLSLNELFEEKTRLEAELKALSSVLDSVCYVFVFLLPSSTPYSICCSEVSSIGPASDYFEPRRLRRMMNMRLTK